jgi:hypothetical protein
MASPPLTEFGTAGIRKKNLDVGMSGHVLFNPNTGWCRRGVQKEMPTWKGNEFGPVRHVPCGIYEAGWEWDAAHGPTGSKIEVRRVNKKGTSQRKKQQKGRGK